MRLTPLCRGRFIKSAPGKDIPDIQIHYVSLGLEDSHARGDRTPPSTPLVVWFIFVALKAEALLGQKILTRNRRRLFGLIIFQLKMTAVI